MGSLLFRPRNHFLFCSNNTAECVNSPTCSFVLGTGVETFDDGEESWSVIGHAWTKEQKPRTEFGIPTPLRYPLAFSSFI